jgi:hypothetical protein
LRAEGARLGEELYGSDPVFLPALLYLARLLVGVDVEGQVVPAGVLPEPLQPRSRHGADAVRGGTDLDQLSPLRPPPQRVHPIQELLHPRVPEAGDTAPGVGDGEQQKPDARLFGGLRYGFGERVRLVVRFSVRAVVHVVELGDARVACKEHLAVAPLARFSDRGGVEALR